ncbi:hypothetical protein R5P06_05675 [Candidatus Thioglobus autotrophicus]|uniref:hypothetical protein n=1 Tax=Candidatus Thioglobus autotrophicus TaxID=1705394 RepID=UPI00299DC5C9|nr:hypothetical protein [Candidatus Thioglobus autotrophicus]WPE16038.1 hypothetical protein R5P06_05675 [Candidatus Thioglobus autotrophicus]
MIKIFIILALLLSGCEDQKNDQNPVLKEPATSIIKKHRHPPAPEEPAICAELSVMECLRIIIPAIWDQVVQNCQLWSV